MQDLDKRARVSLLHDFYGPLLTEKQNEILEFYYDDDLSLGEIAEQCGITRQAVHDLAKRSEKALLAYEERLGLVGRFLEQRSQLESACRVMKDLASGPDREKAEEVLVILKRVMELQM